MSRTKSNLMQSVIIAMTSAGLACNREPPLQETPPLEVVVSQPVAEKVADWDVYTGTVDSKDAVEIRARVRGQIKEVLFKDGDEVEANKPLFVIDDGPFQADLKQAKGQLTSSEASLKAADEKIAIYKPLVEKGTVAKEEMVRALGEKGAALGGIDVAKGKIAEAEVNIAFCKIQSPIAGKIGQAMLTKGNIVNSGGADNLLTTVVSLDPLYVSFYVNDRAMLNYQQLMRERFQKDSKAGQTNIPVEMALATDVDYPYKGVIDFIDNKVDPNTGSIKVRARFDNKKGPDGRRPLTAGLFARVRVTISEPYTATLVADRAVLTDQSLKYVLVVNKAKDNTVERVDVAVSDRVQESGLRVIEAGLKPDMWVIVEGVNRARPGAKVAPKDGPMPRRPAPGK